MNRRQLFSATSASLGLLLVSNRLALSRLQYLATPTAEYEDKPQFFFDDYSPRETMYLGVLLTWLELLEDTIDTLYEGIDAVDVDPDSDEAKAMMLMPLGVWRHLTVDTARITAPESFEVVQEHTLSAFSHLGSAADIISTGVINGNATAITLGTEHINMATEHVGGLVAALPFGRPRRADILG